VGIETKRIYDPPSEADGLRVLVDRLWPRGLSRERAHIDLWLKEIAPSHELRKWFRHEPDKWQAFATRYRDELRDRPEQIRHLLDAARAGPLTLLYSARDRERNQALILRDIVQARLDAGDD
jgi:uncharacterized protein YeaO (DUF488 family)